MHFAKPGSFLIHENSYLINGLHLVLFGVWLLIYLAHVHLKRESTLVFNTQTRTDALTKQNKFEKKTLLECGANALVVIIFKKDTGPKRKKGTGAMSMCFHSSLFQFAINSALEAVLDQCEKRGVDPTLVIY